MDCKASEYRREAKKLRRAAKATKHDVTRATLLKLSEEYERMARHPAENHPKVLPERPLYGARYGDPDFKI